MSIRARQAKRRVEDAATAVEQHFENLGYVAERFTFDGRVFGDGSISMVVVLMVYGEVHTLSADLTVLALQAKYGVWVDIAAFTTNYNNRAMVEIRPKKEREVFWFGG